MKTTERNNSQYQLPPFSTCSLCKNRLSDLCVEECAPNVDYSWFLLKPDLNLEEMPPFPLAEFLDEMPPRVRQVVAAVYLAKIVDHLQGRYEYKLPRFTRTINLEVAGRNKDRNVLPGAVEKESVGDEKESLSP
jgi:hypothetical protein